MTFRLPVPLDTPCAAEFATMAERGGGARHCAACDRVVHDLTGRSDDEVQRLLANGPACVRYLYDASGRRVDAAPPGATLVPASALRTRRARDRWVRAAAVATTLVVLEACGGNDGHRMLSDPSTMPGVMPPLATPPVEPDAGLEDAGTEDAADGVTPPGH